MGKVRDLAEKLWTEKTTTVDVNPLAMFQGLEQVSERLAFVSAFGNVTVFRAAARRSSPSAR